MEKKLKVGLIGLGNILKWAHMLAFSEFEDVEIAAVCDINQEKIESFKKDFNMPDVKGYTDYEELLYKEELDFVDICTPNYLHSTVAVKALEKGVHVLCEKPDAVSVDEALKMKEASEKSGKHLMVIRNNRFRSTSRYLKKYIEEGNAGEIYCGRCGCCYNRGMGKVFYFQPGHETFPIYKQSEIQKIITNAVKWAKTVKRIENLVCPHVKEPIENI